MNLDVVLSFIKKQRVVMVSSVDETGCPNIKAMFPPRRTEGGNVFYLSTNTSSKRVAHFRSNPQSCLYFSRRGLISCTGIMLKGTMEVLEDEASKLLLWKPTDKLYYPLGVTDPDYCVLKFTAAEGRYYRNLKKESFTL